MRILCSRKLKAGINVMKLLIFFNKGHNSSQVERALKPLQITILQKHYVAALHCRLLIPGKIRILPAVQPNTHAIIFLWVTKLESIQFKKKFSPEWPIRYFLISQYHQIRKLSIFSSKNKWVNIRKSKYHTGYRKYECVALHF